MRPGDRKRRWKQNSAGDVTLFVVMGIAAALFLPWPATLIAGFFFFMAGLSILDYHRGWKLRYDLPKHGKRAIKDDDPVAIEAWRRTQELANDPDRQRYAFEKGKK